MHRVTRKTDGFALYICISAHARARGFPRLPVPARGPTFVFHTGKRGRRAHARKPSGSGPGGKLISIAVCLPRPEIDLTRLNSRQGGETTLRGHC